jgi:hypothetical protein
MLGLPGYGSTRRLRIAQWTMSAIVGLEREKAVSGRVADFVRIVLVIPLVSSPLLGIGGGFQN